MQDFLKGGGVSIRGEVNLPGPCGGLYSPGKFPQSWTVDLSFPKLAVTQKVEVKQLYVKQFYSIIFMISKGKTN